MCVWLEWFCEVESMKDERMKGRTVGLCVFGTADAIRRTRVHDVAPFYLQSRIGD
jgi:hypothetical protein